MAITKRAKRAVQQHVTHSYADVYRIVRTRPSVWVADVTFTYGRTSWHERVTFAKRTVRDGQLVVSITDSDYPGDRSSHIVVTRERDMRDVITEYLIAGRW